MQKEVHGQAATKSRHACAKNRTIFSVARAADEFYCGFIDNLIREDAIRVAMERVVCSTGKKT